MAKICIYSALISDVQLAAAHGLRFATPVRLVTLSENKMNDDLFGTITHHIDAWNGEVSTKFTCSGTESIKFHILADETGPTDDQKRLFRDLVGRYESLWFAIARELMKLNQDIKDKEELPLNLTPLLLLSIPGVVGSDIFDFTLGYTFKSDKGNLTGYFMSFIEWEIRSALKAS